MCNCAPLGSQVTCSPWPFPVPLYGHRNWSSASVGVGLHARGSWLYGWSVNIALSPARRRTALPDYRCRFWRRRCLHASSDSALTPVAGVQLEGWARCHCKSCKSLFEECFERCYDVISGIWGGMSDVITARTTRRARWKIWWLCFLHGLRNTVSSRI